MIAWIYAAAIGFMLGLAGQPLLRAIQKNSHPPSRLGAKPLDRLPPLPGPGLAIMAVDARICSPTAIDRNQLDRLFTRVWGAPKPNYEQVLERSFAWVLVFRGGQLLGFANVAWDGGPNYFLMDLSIDPSCAEDDQIFKGMIEAAVQRCQKEGGSVRIDAPEDLLQSFFQPLGFRRVTAGVIHLQKAATG